MRVLIIGGNKFIGPYVVQTLHKTGHEIILFNRGQTKHTFPFPVASIQGDRNDLTLFQNQLLAFHPDIVIDMIPYTERNAEQVGNIFHGKVKRVVIISSCDVYQAYDRLWNVTTDQLISTPLKEQSALRDNFYPYRKILSAKSGDWGYDYEKILVENTIRSYVDLNSTILRLPMVYGPGDHSRIYPYLKRIDDARPILLDENKANWRSSRGYVEDMANAVVLAALDTRTGNRIYNVAEKEMYSELEWINRIAEITGKRYEIKELPHEKLPEHLQEPLAWEQDLTLDTQSIRDELNYKELYSSEIALQKSIDWLRTQKPDNIDDRSFNYDAEDIALAEACTRTLRL
ncbi:MAG: NAD-dependent epimerase/dehydratase family protein [Gammaproteobacteria bacterium]|nr:NAD-dependent epimerase/dehydratase family protein [Gammaproteobacteria bacterium]